MKREVAIILLIMIPLNIFAQITGEQVEDFSDELSKTTRGAWQKLINKIKEIELFNNITNSITNWWTNNARPWIEINFKEALGFFNKEVIIK